MIAQVLGKLIMSANLENVTDNFTSSQVVDKLNMSANLGNVTDIFTSCM